MAQGSSMSLLQSHKLHQHACLDCIEMDVLICHRTHRPHLRAWSLRAGRRHNEPAQQAVPAQTMTHGAQCWSQCRRERHGILQRLIADLVQHSSICVAAIRIRRPSCPVGHHDGLVHVLRMQNFEDTCMARNSYGPFLDFSFHTCWSCLSCMLRDVVLPYLCRYRWGVQATGCTWIETAQ